MKKRCKDVINQWAPWWFIRPLKKDKKACYVEGAAINSRWTLLRFLGEFQWVPSHEVMGCAWMYPINHNLRAWGFGVPLELLKLSKVHHESSKEITFSSFRVGIGRNLLWNFCPNLRQFDGMSSLTIALGIVCPVTWNSRITFLDLFDPSDSFSRDIDKCCFSHRKGVSWYLAIKRI